jgi:hypothetical protein
MSLSRLVSIVLGSRRCLLSRRFVVALITLVCGALSSSAVPALAIRNHVFSGSIGSAGSGASQLSSPASVAVDNSTGPAARDLYVADTGNARIDQFDSSGNFIRAWGWGVADGTEVFETCTLSCQKGISGSGPGQFETPQYIAVDGSSGPSAGDVYVADDGTGLVQKFNSSGELITTWGNNGPGESPNGQLNGSNATPTKNPFGTVEGPFRAPFFGIALDASGSLWVYDGQDFMFEFDQSGAFANSWNSEVAGHPSGIAVDNSDHLYIDGNYERVEKFTSTGSQLGAMTLATFEVGGTPPTGLAIDPATGELYIDADGSLIKRIASSCEPANGICVAAEAFASPQLTGASGLAVASASGTVYAADPTADTVDIFVLHPPGAPIVESQTVSFVTSSSATFSAGINPQDVSTEYHFEYGPDTSYGETVPIPDAAAGSDFEVHEVSMHVQDLSAHTTYHFRVVAHNNDGTIYGEDQTFITQTTGGGGLLLPDGRSWELVTPADKHGALFHAPNVAYWQNAPDPFVAEAAADGKAMIDLASQPTENEPQGYADEVSVFSAHGPEGWSSQVIAPPHEYGSGPSINQGVEYHFFSEDLSRGVLVPFGNFTLLSPEATESTPYLRTDYLGGNVNEHCQTSCFKPLVTAANTPNGTVFGGKTNGECLQVVCGPRFVDATPDASHIVISSEVQLTATPNEGGLYEWSDGQLQPLYLLPKNEGGNGVPAGELSTPSHQLSADGSVFFSHGGHVYLHDFAKDESVRLDVAQGVEEPSEGGAEFLYASSSGSRALFRDSKQLTKTGGGGIYQCRIVEAAGKLTCELELTSLPEGSLIGGSADASYLYLLGTGSKLTVDHYDGQKWTTTNGPFIGTQIFSTESPNPNYRVSSNGRYLAFMSNESLTGYDTRDAISGHPDEEVYLYDASVNRLVCASCNPTGARPTGAISNQTFDLVGGDFGGNTTWVAANVPPWTRSTPGESHYQPRFLSDSGRLFFDSNDALVPQDVNGTQDVYEYEPAGAGRCDTSSTTYGVQSGGCVSLISSGTSPEESALMDVSESGGDVFFITLAKLASEDFDHALDVYDAHECTTDVPCLPPTSVSRPVCSTGDSCKAAPSPQPSIFGPTPSATFSGAGNVVPAATTRVVTPKSLTRARKLAQALKGCRKKSHGQRAVCERKARRRYGKPGKASTKQKGRG